MSRAMTDHLPSASVLRILAVLAIIAAPHLPRMPLWAAGLVVAIGIWRALAAQRAWSMPPTWLRLPLALAGFAALWAQYGTPNGHQAGVALLVLMLAMKLTEMTERRDYLLVIFLSYFLLITHFLFNQDLPMFGLLFLGALCVTTVLVDVNHPQQVMPLRRSARLAGQLLLQAVPLMLLFFVLFPRIPGPLWGLPSDAGAGLTGLSESMEPGSISQLSQSDDVAFRVRFDGETPSRQELYWRGPVFHYFNGRRWLPGAITEFARPVEVDWGERRIDYEIQLEPHGSTWLLALEHAVPPHPSNARLDASLLLRHRDSINDKKLFELSAAPDARIDLDLPDFVRSAALSLPAGSHPRARELAAQWREEHGSDAAVVQAALRHFRREPFTYTLQPPQLPGQHPMDAFLFETQRGFCEHFASAFTILMRAAGIPARVVTGYQGAESNGDYFIVRQSDAHAWSEVWLEGEGWRRYDPTGAVAPNRIEFGLGQAVAEGEPVPALARLRQNFIEDLRLRWDQANAVWNRWVLAYGPELQQSFLGALGLPGVRAFIIALTVGSVLVLAALALWLGYAHRPPAARDPVQRAWQRYRRKLHRLGLAPRDSEGPEDLARRIARERPEWAATASRISRLYVRLRYADVQDAQLQARLKAHIRRFPEPAPGRS